MLIATNKDITIATKSRYIHCRFTNNFKRGFEEARKAGLVLVSLTAECDTVGVDS